LVLRVRTLDDWTRRGGRRRRFTGITTDAWYVEGEGSEVTYCFATSHRPLKLNLGRVKFGRTGCRG
jgi:hypothetical protein